MTPAEGAAAVVFSVPWSPQAEARSAAAIGTSTRPPRHPARMQSFRLAAASACFSLGPVPCWDVILVPSFCVFMVVSPPARVMSVMGAGAGSRPRTAWPEVAKDPGQERDGGRRLLEGAHLKEHARRSLACGAMCSGIRLGAGSGRLCHA